MKLNQKKVDIAFLVAGVILAVSYFVFIQRPLQATLRELQLERKSLHKHIGSEGTVRQKLAQVSQERQKLSQEIEAMELKVKASRPGGLWDIMHEVSVLAEQSGFHKIVLIHPKIETESARQQQNSLLIKLEGEFLPFYRFLSTLEKNNPMLKPRSLRIEPGSGGGSSLVEEIHFELCTPGRLDVSQASELRKPGG
ncbi:MAG: hypothetical protein ACMUIA_12425 [bacterium]